MSNTIDRWVRAVTLLALALCLGYFDGALAQPVNIDTKVQVTFTGFVLNRTSNTFDTQATIKNISADTLKAPMSLVVTSITTTAVTLANASGLSPENKPLVAVGLPPSGLAPGAVVSVVLKFSNPSRVRFSFTASMLGVIEASSGAAAVFYIYPDHLNTPRAITNEANTTVWKWENLDPFGYNAPNEDADGNGQAFVFNLRFPGQYFDKETNLHYNYFRDYDPSIGRYIQSDPIGLEGGINTYGYVGGNPLTFADPTGQFVIVPIVWWAAGAVAIAGAAWWAANHPVIPGNAKDPFGTTTSNTASGNVIELCVFQFIKDGRCWYLCSGNYGFDIPQPRDWCGNPTNCERLVRRQ